MRRKCGPMTLADIVDMIIDGLKMPFHYLVDPDKRIHWLYVLTSALLAYYVYRKARVKSSFWHFLFNKDIWWSRSALVDYGLVFFNGLVKVFLVAPYLIFGLYLAFYTNEWLIDLFGYPESGMSFGWTLFLYTLTLTLVGDFATYVVHYLMHRIPLLWEFHKIHHSATVLNPVTQYRIHPIELLINNAKGIVVFGLVMGLFDYWSANEIDKMTFMGANVFSFVFLAFGANLRHSHVRLKYFNFLEYVFISPYQHQIHHSDNPVHFNRNMGAKLAIWDWIFGTLVRSEEAEDIHFGLGEKEVPRYDSLWKNLYRPFINLARMLVPAKK